MSKTYILRYIETNLYFGKGNMMTSKKKAAVFRTREDAENTAKGLHLGTDVVELWTKK